MSGGFFCPMAESFLPKGPFLPCPCFIKKKTCHKVINCWTSGYPGEVVAYHYRWHPAAQTGKVGRVDLGPTAGSSEKRNRPLPPPARVGILIIPPREGSQVQGQNFEHAPFQGNNTWGILQLSEYESSLVKKSGEEYFVLFLFFNSKISCFWITPNW